MICPHCSAGNAEHAERCVQCGSLLREGDAGATLVGGDVSSAAPAPTNPAAKTGASVLTPPPSSNPQDDARTLMDGPSGVAFAPGTTLGSRYVIEGLLGGGGKGRGLKGVGPGAGPVRGAESVAAGTDARSANHPKIQARIAAGEPYLPQEHPENSRSERSGRSEVHLHGVRGRRGSASPIEKREPVAAGAEPEDCAAALRSAGCSTLGRSRAPGLQAAQRARGERRPRVRLGFRAGNFA